MIEVIKKAYLKEIYIDNKCKPNAVIRSKTQRTTADVYSIVLEAYAPFLSGEGGSDHCYFLWKCYLGC